MQNVFNWSRLSNYFLSELFSDIMENIPQIFPSCRDSLLLLTKKKIFRQQADAVTPNE